MKLKLVLLIVGVLTIGLIPAWTQYGGFMLTADFMNQQIPFIIETKRMLSSGVPFWSWNTYFGDNFIAAYSFYTVTSPFVWINCLFPVSLIYYSITLTLYLKFIVLGLLSYQLLLKMSLSKESSLMAALMFVFSSYVIICIGYYHFMEPMICFILLLYAIEKFVNDERYSWILLSIASFGVVFINFYFVPCTFLSALVYFIFRVQEAGKSSFKIYLRACSSVLVGMMMSSVILLPTLYHMIGGPRTDMSLWSGYFWEDRLFSIFNPKLRDGNIPFVRDTGWTSTAANIPVAGALLAGLFVLSNMRSAVSRTIVCLLVLYLTPLNSVFSLFTDPTYTRWVYALTFFLAVATAKVIDSKKTVSLRSYWIYVGICVAVYLYRYTIPVAWRIYKGIQFVDDEIVYTVIQVLLLVLELVLLYVFLFKASMKRRVGLVAFFACLHFACFLFMRSDEYARVFDGGRVKIGMFDKYVRHNAIEYNEGANEYRTDFITRTQPYYSNVALLKNIPSVQTYNSVRNNNILNLLLSADSTYTSKQNSFQRNINATSFDALMSVKYVVDYKDSMSTISLPDDLKLVEEKKGYDVYESNNYLPLGFTYDSYMLQSEVDSLLLQKPKPDIPLMMLASLAVCDEDVPVFSKYLVRRSGEADGDVHDVAQRRRLNVCANHEMTTRGFTCQSSLEKEAPLFFSVPADDGFAVTIDGRETRLYKVNCGLSAIIAPAGKHEIRFDFVPRGLKLGGAISGLSMLLLLVCYIVERKKLQL